MTTFWRLRFRFAKPITESAPLSLRASKLACDGAVAGRSYEVTAEVTALSAIADQSADYREGARAFAEKRKPVFTGR